MLYTFLRWIWLDTDNFDCLGCMWCLHTSRWADPDEQETCCCQDLQPSWCCCWSAMVIIKFSLHISDYEMKIYEMMKHIDDPLMTYIESDLSPKEKYWQEHQNTCWYYIMEDTYCFTLLRISILTWLICFGNTGMVLSKSTPCCRRT